MNAGLNCRLASMRGCESGWKKNWPRRNRMNDLSAGRVAGHTNSLCVVVDDAESVARASADAADAMPKRNAIVAARSADGTIACRENNALALVGCDHFCARLRARHVFNEDKLSAFPIETLLAKHDHQLKRERDFPV